MARFHAPHSSRIRIGPLSIYPTGMVFWRGRSGVFSWWNRLMRTRAA